MISPLRNGKFSLSKSKSSCLSYIFVETIPLHIDIKKSLRKVLRYQKNCVYLAEVPQNVLYEPSMQSKLRKLSKRLRNIMKHNRTNTSV